MTLVETKKEKNNKGMIKYFIIGLVSAFVVALLLTLGTLIMIKNTYG